MSEYPEHDKLIATKPNSDIIGEFLEWCEYEKDWYLMNDYGIDTWKYESIDIEKALASFFDIDLKKIADEKDQMLAELRRQNESRS